MSAAASGITTAPNPRVDYRLIADLIEPGSRVLDLGCGDGTLLKMLVDEKQVSATGVEMSYDSIRSCIEKGLSVLHGDLDEGLSDYADGSFDYVIVSQTLQAVRKPALVLSEVVRVAKAGIVTFPNFGYWRVRWELLCSGRMPKTDYLPFEWYDTPNIHLLTLNDFKHYCAQHHLTISRALYLVDGQPVEFLPNLRAKLAIVVVQRDAAADGLPQPFGYGKARKTG